MLLLPIHINKNWKGHHLLLYNSHSSLNASFSIVFYEILIVHRAAIHNWNLFMWYMRTVNEIHGKNDCSFIKLFTYFKQKKNKKLWSHSWDLQFSRAWSCCLHLMHHIRFMNNLWFPFNMENLHKTLIKFSVNLRAFFCFNVLIENHLLQTCEYDFLF